MSKPDFREALRDVINQHSRENGSNTPDYILAAYLLGCLEAFDNATRARERWYGVELTVFPSCSDLRETIARRAYIPGPGEVAK